MRSRGPQSANAGLYVVWRTEHTVKNVEMKGQVHRTENASFTVTSLDGQLFCCRQLVTSNCAAARIALMQGKNHRRG